MTKPVKKPIKVVEAGPKTIAPQWALFQGMDIVHHFLPEADFKTRAELATYIAESLYWCAQPLTGGPPQEPLIVEIGRLRAALTTMDRELHLIAGQCGTPDAAEGCRLILKTVERARDVGKTAMEERDEQLG